MITLTGNTALQIYAQSGIAEEASGSPSCNGLDWGHGRAKDLLDLEELGISPSPEHPVDILVDHRDHRIQSNKVVNHVCQSKLPPHAVVRLAPGVFIATPEFCFLEAAKQGVAYAAAGPMGATTLRADLPIEPPFPAWRGSALPWQRQKAIVGAGMPSPRFASSSRTRDRPWKPRRLLPSPALKPSEDTAFPPPYATMRLFGNRDNSACFSLRGTSSTCAGQTTWLPWSATVTHITQAKVALIATA